MTESHNKRAYLTCHYIYVIESHTIELMKNEKYISNLIGTFTTFVSNDIEKADCRIRRAKLKPRIGTLHYLQPPK